MNDIEVLNDKLKSFDDIEEIKNYVLYCFKKDKSKIEKWKHKKLSKKYDWNIDKNQKAITQIMDAYLTWGLIEEIVKVEDEKKVYYKCITEKGRKVLKWRYIAPLKPEWLTANRKYIITTSIAVAALLVSIIALFRTF